MKQIGSFSRLAGVCALFALVANLSLSAAVTGNAEITGIKGTVKVDGQAVKVGDSIAPGQQIETGAASQLNLFLGENGPTLVVAADARLSFDELSSDKAGAEPIISTKINLKSGKVAGYVKKTSSQSKYVVQTPTTTAAIRGTEYEVDADTGVVSVWSGCVTVTWRGNNYDVCAGQKFDPSIGAVVANDLPNPFPRSARSFDFNNFRPMIPLRPNPGSSTPQPNRSGGQ
jgi:hypothetical protein